MELPAALAIGRPLAIVIGEASPAKWKLVYLLIPLSIGALAFDLLGCRFGC